MIAQTLTLSEFLLARYAEEEATAAKVHRWVAFRAGDGNLSVGSENLEPRVLADIAAKRRIVEIHKQCPTDDDPAQTGCGICDYDGDCSWQHASDNPGGCETLVALASVYATHPDFNESWR